MCCQVSLWLPACCRISLLKMLFPGELAIMLHRPEIDGLVQKTHRKPAVHSLLKNKSAFHKGAYISLCNMGILATRFARIKVWHHLVSHFSSTEATFMPPYNQSNKPSDIHKCTSLLCLDSPVGNLVCSSKFESGLPSTNICSVNKELRLPC